MLLSVTSLMRLFKTSSSIVAAGPHNVQCQLKSY